jgi:hypothetical protein
MATDKVAMNTTKILPYSLLFLFSCSLPLTEVPSSRNPAATPQEDHFRKAKIANRPVVDWYTQKSQGLLEWIKKRGQEGGIPDFIDFYLPDNDVAVSLTRKEALIAEKTKQLYDQYFPRNDHSSYVGTFFESGHPLIQTYKGPYQWDSMKVTGMKDPVLFRKTIQTLVKSGIKSFRLGPNIHEVGQDKKSWKNFITQIETIWMEGGTPTIAVAFFPSLTKWEVRKAGKIDYRSSYLLHRDWPSDMGKLTAVMMSELWKKAREVEEKLGKKVNILINGINEPETFAGFNSGTGPSPTGQIRKP